MKKVVVTKANQLNEARYRLTLNEQRLILTVVSMIQPQDEDFKIYKVKVSDFLNLLGLKSKGNYQKLKNTTKNLLSKTLIIQDNPKHELQASWFSSVEYNEGIVTFSFDPRLKPFFIQLKEKFVSYPLSNILNLSSAHSIRIYELLKQYERIGKRKILVDELRGYLGFEKDEYTEYSNLKHRVLKKAQNEIEQKTDISFNYKEIKESRRVVELLFSIRKNTQTHSLTSYSALNDFIQDYNLPLQVEQEMKSLLDEGKKLNTIIHKIKEDYNLN